MSGCPCQTHMQVPTTFSEMFLFNAAVMGFAESSWMTLILDQFHNIVTNVANSYRLQEECDVLTLVLDKHEGQVHLSEFKAHARKWKSCFCRSPCHYPSKAVMLSSLRSLVPKEWDSEHEVAWNWLWESPGCTLPASWERPGKVSF